MTLLRRAPREVYRVYDEDEFFASAGIGQCGEAPTPTPELDRHAHRVAGVTVLVAAVGAVAGLVVITSVSPSARAGRRAGARLSADGGAVGRSHEASTRIWNAPADTDGAPAGDETERAASANGGGSATLARRVEMARRAAATRRTAGSTITASASPAADGSAQAAASSGAATVKQPEFGFER
ncbi:MAG TPA: hypothetical protein VK790_10455 [Solirubrobacteraceae bacterium]|jgi:hypothetical protein|nr:hypothetical protein [Solirubrobacteraceae bacterium]